MRKMTQAEFNTLKRNESGYLVIPDCTDCTEIDFGAANKVIFGYMCKLGNRCKLGDECKLGEYIDVRATFEDGCVQDGLYVQVGNIGSEHRIAHFYVDKDGTMFVRAGCWFSGMDEFKTRVKSVHGGTIYEAQYMAACAYAEAVLPQMLKESDAARKTADGQG